MNKAIERTNILKNHKARVLIDPKLLTDLHELEEEKLLGQRTVFLKFHQYIYALTDEEIERLFLAFKQFTTDARKASGSLAFNDYLIIHATIFFHHCLRSKEGLHHECCDQFAADYIFEKNSAECFPEVTSKHLIRLTEDIIKNFTGEKKFEFI